MAVPLLLGTYSAARAAESWIGIWGSDPVVATPDGYAGKTVRQTIHLTGGGQSVRLRLSNAFGDENLVVGAAAVARPALGDGTIVPGSAAPVTFGGARAIVVAPHATILSDPVARSVASGEDLSVSLYLAGGARPSAHPLALDPGFAAPGDQTAAAALTGATPLRVQLVVSGVDAAGAAAGAAGGTIVALGDSITDGFRSTPGLDRRWTDVLARRLAATQDLAGFGVVDAGISGNRLLGDGQATSGPNALSRLPRDVLALPGLRFVCLLEGINDILAGAAARDGARRITAAHLIAGYKQVIDQVHEHGAKVLIGTLTPASARGYTEAVRQETNAWIRAGRGFDGVLDFDAALRDPSQPSQFLARYDSGDHLHPNDDGYAAMADAVNLSLFR
ncbi:MAG: SGNH/GDSL hydrolase family protein [Caulobacteraceae bacterium]|nr:SGNH/GDSL hydrolase family protein [Caulobacter sp.]